MGFKNFTKRRLAKYLNNHLVLQRTNRVSYLMKEECQVFISTHSHWLANFSTVLILEPHLPTMQITDFSVTIAF